MALETASMQELEAQVRTCQLCRLAKTRTKAVPGEGNPRAEVMFIGEGPGFNEDKQGRPFVGAAGHFLNELLGIAGLDRSSVYITNVVKCRPPGNRDPEPEEIAACAPYLERQIALINPRVLVTLGRYSMARYFPGERISQIHGTARLVEGRICVAMYHPSAGLHQASLADTIRSDFRKLPVFIEQARLMSGYPLAGVTGEEDIKSLAEAEVAREEVIHDTETAAILQEDIAPASGDAVELFAEEEFAGTPLIENTQSGDSETADGGPTEAPAAMQQESDEEDGPKQLAFF